MSSNVDYIHLLLEACERGELEAVKFIVEGLSDIDAVNSTATYQYGPRTLRTESKVESASPLFIAAGFCHLHIASYLIDSGADLNSRTGHSRLDKFAGMTPIHSAVSLRSDKTLAQKRAMIALLLSNGADAAALNAEGSSIWKLFYNQGVVPNLIIDIGVSLMQQFPGKNCALLHYWASSSQGCPVAVFDLLLAKGADLKSVDYYGLSPLIVAAIGYSRFEFIGTNEPALRYLLDRDEFNLSEKINAMELAGAMILLKASTDPDGSITSKALRYWNEAIELRIIPKVSLNLGNEVNWRTIEWTTREDLKELQHYSLDELKIHAILVACRILANISSKALARFLWSNHVEKYCASLLYMEQLDAQVLQVCWILLEGTRAITDDLRDPDLWEMIVTVINWIKSSLLRLKADQILSVEMLNLSLELVFEITRNRWPSTLSDHRIHQTPMLSIYQIIVMLAHSPEIVTETIKNRLRQFVERDQRDSRGYNLLLLACDQQPSSGTLAIIRFLLEVGRTDPDVKNEKGSSPLHLVVFWMKQGEFDSPIAALLLQHGAHLDVANKLGKTPLDVWKEKQDSAGRILSPPSWLNPVHRLYCWSARVIQRNDISYAHLNLPKNIRDFVAKH